MKFLFDENLPPTWVTFCETRNLDAVSWLRGDQMGAPDTVVWDYAVKYGYVIVTKDLDFGRMLAERRSQHPSVLQLRVDNPSPMEWGSTFLQTIQTHENLLKTGCLISINQRTQRVRLLPIR